MMALDEETTVYLWIGSALILLPSDSSYVFRRTLTFLGKLILRAELIRGCGLRSDIVNLPLLVNSIAVPSELKGMPKMSRYTYINIDV